MPRTVGDRTEVIVQRHYARTAPVHTEDLRRQNKSRFHRNCRRRQRSSGKGNSLNCKIADLLPVHFHTILQRSISSVYS